MTNYENMTKEQLIETLRDRDLLRDATAHDVGGLVQLVTSFVGLSSKMLRNYREGNDQEALDSAYDLIRRADFHGAILIDNFEILGLKALDLEYLRENSKPINLRKCFDQKLERNLRNLADRKVVTYLQRDMPKDWRGNNPVLELIFGNILGNARKYSIRDSEIDFRVSVLERNLIIEQSNVCEPYSQDQIQGIINGNYTLGKSEGHGLGSGLGISLIRKLAEKTGGNLEVDFNRSHFESNKEYDLKTFGEKKALVGSDQDQEFLRFYMKVTLPELTEAC